jgi:hypothetical protein
MRSPPESKTRACINVALVFTIAMASTTLPTPIYHPYQIAYRFSPSTITVIYATYALGVPGGWLVMGNWPDQAIRSGANG